MTALADCWIPGEPPEDGFYLTRWDCYGNSWVHLFEVREFPSIMRGKLYFNGLGGNRPWDPAMRSLGDITHYCLPTPENFAKVYAGLTAEIEARRKESK